MEEYGYMAKELKKQILNKKKDLNLTYNDLQKMTGISASTINRYLTGNIEKLDINKIILVAKSLNISLSQLYENRSDAKAKLLPVVGVVHDGEPIFAHNNIESYEPIYLRDINDYDELFYLRIVGDSMKGAGILNGDLVLVKKQPTVENGDIAVVMIDKENAVLKRVIKDKKGIILKSENLDYEPIYFPEKEKKRLRVIGKIILNLRKY